MPEQQRASDPDMEEVQQYLDTLRVASNSNNRFSSFAGDDLCQCPRRKSSSSHLDYRTALRHSVDSYFLNDEKDSVNPLQGDIDSYESLYTTGLEQDDEALPLSFTPPRSRNYAVGMSSVSLDLDDICDESDDTPPNTTAETSNPSVDVSPQMARRRSSITCTSSADRSAAGRLPIVNLLAAAAGGRSQDHDEGRHYAGDSGDICLAGSDRFETRCPKEKTNSISQPTRRESTYTLDLRSVAHLTTILQGEQL